MTPKGTLSLETSLLSIPSTVLQKRKTKKAMSHEWSHTPQLSVRQRKNCKSKWKRKYEGRQYSSCLACARPLVQSNPQYCQKTHGNIQQKLKQSTQPDDAFVKPKEIYIQWRNSETMTHRLTVLRKMKVSNKQQNRWGNLKTHASEEE